MAQSIIIVDKNTLKEVHTVRMKLQKARTKITADRKSFTAHLDETKKSAIAIETELIALIEPVEKKLDEIQTKYEEEQERIKKEEQEREEKILQERLNELNKYNVILDVAEVKKMTQERFRSMADTYKQKFEEREAERVKAEEEKKKQEEKEREELQKQKEEQEKIAQEQAEKARELAEKEKAMKDKEEEQKRQEDERKQQAELEKRQKKFAEDHKKYQEWLANNGWTEENQHEYTTAIQRHGKDNKEIRILLYKKVSSYDVPVSEDPENQNDGEK